MSLEAEVATKSPTLSSKLHPKHVPCPWLLTPSSWIRPPPVRPHSWRVLLLLLLLRLLQEQGSFLPWLRPRLWCWSRSWRWPPAPRRRAGPLGSLACIIMWWRVCESVVAKASNEECFGFFYAQQCETRGLSSLLAPTKCSLSHPPAAMRTSIGRSLKWCLWW